MAVGGVGLREFSAGRLRIPGARLEKARRPRGELRRLGWRDPSARRTPRRTRLLGSRACARARSGGGEAGEELPLQVPFPTQPSSAIKIRSALFLPSGRVGGAGRGLRVEPAPRGNEARSGSRAERQPGTDSRKRRGARELAGVVGGARGGRRWGEGCHTLGTSASIAAVACTGGRFQEIAEDAGQCSCLHAPLQPPRN